MKINNCKCGSNNVEFVKLFDKNRYDGFVRCNDCGCEGRVYTSKQNAVKAWNRVNTYYAGFELGDSEEDYVKKCVSCKHSYTRQDESDMLFCRCRNGCKYEKVV